MRSLPPNSKSFLRYVSRYFDFFRDETACQKCFQLGWKWLPLLCGNRLSSHVLLRPRYKNCDQNKNLAQQLNDLNQAKEEAEKLKARTIDLPDYNATVIIPEEYTFSNSNWPGIFAIKDPNFISDLSSENNILLQVLTTDQVAKEQAYCEVNGCDGDGTFVVKEFAAERDLWKHDKTAIASFPGRTYEIKTLHGIKYAVLNVPALGGEGYIRQYFTFLNDNTKLEFYILALDQSYDQVIENFMSNVSLVIN